MRNSLNARDFGILRLFRVCGLGPSGVEASCNLCAIVSARDSGKARSTPELVHRSVGWSWVLACRRGTDLSVARADDARSSHEALVSP